MSSELEVGSAEWCAAARRLCATFPHRPGVSFRLQFASTNDAGERVDWHQVVDDGQVVAWDPGADPAADLELHLRADGMRALFQSELSGTDALAAMGVAVPGGPVRAAPPLDIRDVPELRALPEFPGATLVVQYDFAAGPFGPVGYWMAFEDGLCSGVDFGRADDPDVRVAITFAKMAAVRRGELTILEALEDGGQVAGDLGPLMLLAGLEESAELSAAELACGDAGTILGRVGRLTQSPEYQAAMAQLAMLTR